MKGLLQEKSVLITGASSGIGAATTLLCLEEGARVLATDINSERGEALVRDLESAFSGRVRFLKQDVASEDDWIKVFEEMVSTFGPPDVLVNNAGVLHEQISLSETSLDTWREVMAVNLDGSFLGVKHAFRNMSGRGGAIINISSVAGLVGIPLSGAYGASKGGVLLLTKVAALEGARLDPPVRVNAVHPGYIRTDMTGSISDNLGSDRFDHHLRRTVPLKTMGKPEQVADSIAFLASDKSQLITGSSLVIDGGWTAQ